MERGSTSTSEPSRDDVLRVAYKSLRDRLPDGCSLEWFLEMTQDEEAIPVVVRGELAGAILIKGAEVHACILPRFYRRWMTRGLIRTVKAKVLGQHPVIRTRVFSGNPATNAFVQRLGFSAVSQRDGITIYEGQ